MDILTSVENGILTIEFNRLERKNAITIEMYAMMAEAINKADQDSAVRVILFKGKPEAFTAGNDLSDFLKGATEGLDIPIEERPVFQFMRALKDCSKPAIAAISGPVVGIGTTLLMHCELVYAAENTKLSVPFAPLGVCPEFGSSLLLPQIVGYQRAAEKLYFGEPFTAREAFEMGLVNKVLPVEELFDYAYSQATKLAQLPPASVRATKRLMRSRQKELLDATIAEENQLFGKMLQGDEAREAFTAFFQKRKPDFSRFS